MTETYRVGSGKLYMVEVEAVDGVYAIPADNEIETDRNRLGLVSGGASISYTPTLGNVRDDLGELDDTYLQEEEVVFTSGILTWDTESLGKLTTTGVVTEDATNHKRTIQIGGFENYANTKYIVRFLHEDAVKGDLRVTLVGTASNGWEISLQNDNPTTINAEFRASAGCGDVGVLLNITEDIPQ